MKYLITVFTILFVSSIFVLSAYGIEAGVSDQVSATNSNDTTKSTGATGIDQKSMPMTQEMMESNQATKMRDSKLQLKNKKRARLMDSKESTNGSQTSSSNDLMSEKNIKPNSVKPVVPSPRPAPIEDRPQR